MINQKELRDFYRGKRVMVTGHTGFKGTWLSKILVDLGADVCGYALEPPTEPSLFRLVNMHHYMQSHIGDIRDLTTLQDVFCQVQPELVIHMAAQPIVRESYKNPVITYETNVMGTVNLLECSRMTGSVKSVVNVTTDKVYRNNEWDKGYVETDYLDGYDPYSNSKSCSELVTHSYVQSFLKEQGVAVSTCRAGNVIGGGDFAADRIVPDCVRAVMSGEDIIIRNPNSTRPYQHVLEPLFAYLLIAMRQYCNQDQAGSYNVGPDDESCVSTGKLVEMFCTDWMRQLPESKASWSVRSDGGPHEANYLKLNCSLLKNSMKWRPQWSINQAIHKVVEFEKIRYNTQWIKTDDELQPELYTCMEHQITDYLSDMSKDVVGK